MANYRNLINLINPPSQAILNLINLVSPISTINLNMVVVMATRPIVANIISFKTKATLLEDVVEAFRKEVKGRSTKLSSITM